MQEMDLLIRFFTTTTKKSKAGAEEEEEEAIVAPGSKDNDQNICVEMSSS